MDYVNCISVISSCTALHVVLIVIDKEIKEYFGNTRILRDFCVHIPDFVSFGYPLVPKLSLWMWYLVSHFWGCNALNGERFSLNIYLIYF